MNRDAAAGCGITTSSSVRVAGFSVVFQSTAGGISPSPLKRVITRGFAFRRRRISSRAASSAAHSVSFAKSSPDFTRRC